jgi:hypothetical protein
MVECREVGSYLRQVIDRADRQHQVRESCGDNLRRQVGVGCLGLESEWPQGFRGVDLGAEGGWALEH